MNFSGVYYRPRILSVHKYREMGNLIYVNIIFDVRCCLSGDGFDSNAGDFVAGRPVKIRAFAGNEHLPRVFNGAGRRRRYFQGPNLLPGAKEYTGDQENVANVIFESTPSPYVHDESGMHLKNIYLGLCFHLIIVQDFQK